MTIRNIDVVAIQVSSYENDKDYLLRILEQLL